MATNAAVANRLVSNTFMAVLDADRHDGFGIVLSATLPLALFVSAHGLAQLAGVQPLYFSPFGMPGWLGAALHLGSLPLFGAARWLVAGRGAAGQKAGWWIVALIAGMIACPFLIGSLDAMQSSVLTFVLLVIGLGAMIRAGAVDPVAALLMAPGMAWMGLGAFVGLSFAAAWSPPFALTNNHGGA